MAFIHQMTTSQRRALTSNGDIDETLFATKKTSKRTGNATVISSDILKKLSVDTGSNNINPHDAVVITTTDLDQIKDNSSILSPADAATRKKFSESSRLALAEKAKLRKEKMLKMEKERKAIAPKTEEEIEDEKRRDSLLGHAKSKMDEEHDDVKHMNQMALYAKCVTIRDAQILEKQRIAEELVEEEKRLDMAMEVERIKAMKAFEEREAVRQAEQKIGAQIIIKQIQEREQERIRQQETREQEAQAMVQRVRELEQKEEEERLEKIARGRRLLGQVMEANDAQARAKLRKKQEEIDEDARISEYIRQKEERERHQEAELERIRADKEYEIARLRAMQEKAQDRQSAIDELRAKRYQETKDRQWRQQQLEMAQKKEAMKRDIALARENQRQEKARRIAEQALQEREEYLRVLEWQQTQNGMDQRRAEVAGDAAKKHRSELQKQIQTREREKEEARTHYLEEGKLIQQQLEAEKKKLLKLKQQKLNELGAAGVPEKYRSELAKKKVCVSSIH